MVIVIMDQIVRILEREREREWEPLERESK
jgi:hypothetical protein